MLRLPARVVADYDDTLTAKPSGSPPAFTYLFINITACPHLLRGLALNKCWKPALPS